MKNAWTCLLLIFYLGSSYSILKCNKNDNCLCIPGEKFEFQCPKKNEDETASVIHVKDNENVQIYCIIDMDQFEETLLPNITTTKIEAFSIKSCPLPKSSFREILNRFAIHNLKYFEFSNSKLANLTLTKDYFDGLDQLVNLKLVSNNLSDFEDDVFSTTPNLTSLELQGNQIQLKSNLFKYTPLLEALDLSENKIVSIPSGIFQPLHNLKILHMWGNNLSTLDEFMFEGLVHLTSLELSVSNIEDISENTFSNLTDLTQISLMLNKLKTLPSRLFFNNKKLKFIRIARNFFKLELSDLLFSNLPHLEIVDLTNSKIDIIPNHLFENSTNLQKIFLQNNNIRYLSQDIFKQLQNLEEMNLNSNRMEDISDNFTPLKKLKKLFLCDNKITEIGETTFLELNNLEEIDLSRNKINKIHLKAFTNNKNLRKINLSHNYLHSKKEPYAIFEDIVSLVNVDLSYNLITQIYNVIPLYNKVNLTQLDLSYNQITKIKLIDLQPMGNKLLIKLENNNITTVDFENMNDLTLQEKSNFNSRSVIIDLSNNPIDCDCLNYDFVLYLKNEIMNEIKDLYNIHGENLACANPPELKDVLVKELHPSRLTCSLEKLTNENIGCPEECSCIWTPFYKSIVIDCAKKNLTQYPKIQVKPSSKFPFNQTELNLTNNILEMGPDGNLSGYENITRLFLSYNKIKEISWLPPRLKEMHLDNNKLKHLDYKILDAFNASGFTNLTLYNNPWKCECKTHNLSNFLRQHTRQIESKDIFCFNSTIKLINLNRNDLCPEWQNVYTALLVMFFLLLLAITVALYYRYQEEIKAWLWIHNYCLCCVGEEDLDKDKIYDAFISYSHKDEDFVTQNLLPVLEGVPNSYNLCLHGRNWVPGEFISKQIITSVMESKRTIVIVSPNFLESVWGLIEFRTAHTQAMTDGRARVIVVLYGDIDMDQLDPELKMYLKTNTYVKWGDSFFWNKLKYALPHRKYNASTTNPPNISQKHANIMNGIDDKFKLVAPVTVSPGSTPPVLNLDPTLLKKHPLHFVPSPELDTPPAEAGTLLT